VRFAAARRAGRGGLAALAALAVLACSLPDADKSAGGAAAAIDEQVVAGELAAGDAVLEAGELADDYPLEGVPGQLVRLRLSSPDFDTYLILVGPDGLVLHNDDDDYGDSSIETRLGTAGPHRIVVTSYAAGETGRYSLAIGLGDVLPLPEVQAVDLGSRLDGRLEDGDERLTQGELADRYTFMAEAGTPVDLVMSSGEIDTYLGLSFPDGTVLSNDDDWEETSRSRLELTLPQTGAYEVVATSYAAAEVGAYRLTIERSTAADPPPLRGAAGRTLALLVGIGDYGGRISNLENTAEDARSLEWVLRERAGVEPEDTVLLVDAEATMERFRRSLAGLAARMTAGDQIVVFYSGHGGRVRRGSFQAADPDAVDETLSLYDGELSDDELAALLDAVPGRILLILDSCFSGGFAKDVISAPGRMGLFSSEEDVTSSVAEKFRAGGFLAAFLVEALEGDWADDGDGRLTALELSHYLHERFRTDVKGSGPEDVVLTDGRQLGYQRLVVDRGSISPVEVLFHLRPAASGDSVGL
jgi:hypothetical protein